MASQRERNYACLIETKKLDAHFSLLYLTFNYFIVLNEKS